MAARLLYFPKGLRSLGKESWPCWLCWAIRYEDVSERRICWGLPALSTSTVLAQAWDPAMALAWTDRFTLQGRLAYHRLLLLACT